MATSETLVQRYKTFLMFSLYLHYLFVFFLWLFGLTPFLSILPSFISLWSSVPPPRAFKNLNYFIFPLASNQFQMPLFPVSPPLPNSFLSLPPLGAIDQNHTHTYKHTQKWGEKDRVSMRHRESQVLLAFP